jgi:hypothetical protein
MGQTCGQPHSIKTRAGADPPTISQAKRRKWKWKCTFFLVSLLHMYSCTPSELRVNMSMMGSECGNEMITCEPFRWRPAGGQDNGAIQRRDVSIVDKYLHDAPIYIQIQALEHFVLKVCGSGQLSWKTSLRACRLHSSHSNRQPIVAVAPPRTCFGINLRSRKAMYHKFKV